MPIVNDIQSLVIGKRPNRRRVLLSSTTISAVLTDPVAIDVTPFSETLSANTDTNSGTMYFIVSTSANTPSRDQMTSGLDGDGNAAANATSVTVTSLANGTITKTVTGLLDNTNYYAYFYQFVTGPSNIVTTTFDTADVVTPVLSAPTAGVASPISGTAGITTDTGLGTLYYVVSSSSGTPNTTQMKTGLDNTGNTATFATSGAVIASGVQDNINITGLLSGYTYYVHFYQEDATGFGFSNKPNTSLTTAGTGFIVYSEPHSIYYVQRQGATI